MTLGFVSKILSEMLVFLWLWQVLEGLERPVRSEEEFPLIFVKICLRGAEKVSDLPSCAAAPGTKLLLGLVKPPLEPVSLVPLRY